MGLVNGESASVLDSVAITATRTNAGTTRSSTVVSDNNYAISVNEADLVVTKANATVTANSDSKTYNGLSQSVTGFTVSGLVNGETISVLDGISGATATGTNARIYTVTASGTDENYNLAFVDGTLTINKVPLTLTANDASKTYDGLVYTGGNGVSYGGFVNGETSSVLGGTLSYGGSSQGAINVGTYAISLSGYTASNYQLDYRDGLLTINAMTQQPNVSHIVNGTAVNPPMIPALTQPTPPTPTPQPFNFGGQQVQLVGTPIGDVPTELIGMQEVRGMMGGGVGDVRIPLGQNSLIQLVNGGVRLPNGIEQEFFMAQR